MITLYVSGTNTDRTVNNAVWPSLSHRSPQARVPPRVPSRGRKQAPSPIERVVAREAPDKHLIPHTCGFSLQCPSGLSPSGQSTAPVLTSVSTEETSRQAPIKVSRSDLLDATPAKT
jgi:hypothetical protein